MSKLKRGQGIGALLSSMDADLIDNPEQEIVTQLSGSVAEIPLTQIEIASFHNPRVTFDQDALNELAESIKIHGIIQPLTVRRLENDRYELISGERRFRASKMAGLESVPVYVRLANDQEMLEMALVENIQRQDLNAIEVAMTYKRLMDECDLTHEGLSGRVGKNRSTVTNYLRLLKLPPAIQAALKDNVLSMGHARALISIDDPALQLSIFNEAVAQSLNVRQVEELVAAGQQAKAAKKAEKAAPKAGLGEDYRRVQDNLTSLFGTKVLLKVGKDGKGSLSVPFSGTADLNRILELIEKQ